MGIVLIVMVFHFIGGKPTEIRRNNKVGAVVGMW